MLIFSYILHILVFLIEFQATHGYASHLPWLQCAHEMQSVGVVCPTPLRRTRFDFSQSIHTLEETRYSNVCLLNLPMIFFFEGSVLSLVLVKEAGLKM